MVFTSTVFLSRKWFSLCHYILYAGNWRDVTWPDKWTAVTVVSVVTAQACPTVSCIHVATPVFSLSPPLQDGKRSAQFEQTLLVTETGYKILTIRTEMDGKPHFMTS